MEIDSLAGIFGRPEDDFVHIEITRVEIRPSTSPRIAVNSVSTAVKRPGEDERRATKYFAGLGSREIPISALAFQSEKMVIDTIRQFVFAHQRKRPLGDGTVKNRRDVGIAVKAAARLSDVVGDDHVEILLAQFLFGIGGQFFGFGGKTD